MACVQYEVSSKTPGRTIRQFHQIQKVTVANYGCNSELWANTAFLAHSMMIRV